MKSDDEVSLDLGNMRTQWTMIRKAHQASMVGNSASAARQALVMRYAPAIRRFVQVVVRNPSLADELAQDAIVRVLRGDFAGNHQNIRFGLHANHELPFSSQSQLLGLLAGLQNLDRVVDSLLGGSVSG